MDLPQHFPLEMHTGDDWDIEDSEFDDFIWKDLTDSNDKREKGSE